MIYRISKDNVKNIANFCGVKQLTHPNEVMNISKEDFLLVKRDFLSEVCDLSSELSEPVCRQTVEHFMHDLYNYLFVADSCNLLLAKFFNQHTTDLERKILEKSSLTIKHIIELCQEFSCKLHSGNFSPPQKILLTAIIQKLTTLFAQEVRDTNVELTTHLRGEPQVMANETILFQCLVNLFRNALEHVKEIPAGERWIKISLTNESLCIENAGSFDKNCNLDQIFEHGYTTKSTQSNKGLGLSIVKQNLNNYGLDIKISNKENVCFCIELQTNLKLC